MKLIYIEDDQALQIPVKTILEDIVGEGNVDIARNGAEALKKASVEKYDVFVVDYHLPDVTGCDLAVYLQSKNIIFFTGDPDAVRAKCTEFTIVDKQDSFNISVLKKAINDLQKRGTIT